MTFAVPRSPALMDKGTNPLFSARSHTLLHMSGRHVMDERTRRHQASPSRARTAGRTRKSVSKDLLMNGQPYPQLGGCVWHHFTGRARLPPRCWFPLPCDKKKTWVPRYAARRCRGMLHADQQGQLFSKTHVHTQFFWFSRWPIRSKHRVCARGRSMPSAGLLQLIALPGSRPCTHLSAGFSRNGFASRSCPYASLRPSGSARV